TTLHLSLGRTVTSANRNHPPLDYYLFWLPLLTPIQKGSTHPRYPRRFAHEIPALSRCLVCFISSSVSRLHRFHTRQSSCRGLFRRGHGHWRQRWRQNHPV